jgi:hypothetical protein
MTPEHAIATEMLLLQAEQEIDRLKAQIALLEKERQEEADIQLKIALKADHYYMQLQAIREAAFGEIHGITAEDLSFMSERE